MQQGGEWQPEQGLGAMLRGGERLRRDAQLGWRALPPALWLSLAADHGSGQAGPGSAVAWGTHTSALDTARFHWGPKGGGARRGWKCAQNATRRRRFSPVMSADARVAIVVHDMENVRAPLGQTAVLGHSHGPWAESVGRKIG